MIAITGTSGFVGAAVLAELLDKDKKIVNFTRKQKTETPCFKTIIIPTIDEHTDYKTNLEGVECIIHCAAKVHESELDNNLDSYRKINTLGTLNLANQAVKSGVKRFIFISTIKVNGEETNKGESFTSNGDCNPVGSYAISKYEAEIELLKLGKNTGLEVVIIRPPLVYGQGVKANFEVMMKWIVRSFPLPFGKIKSIRSFVSIDNLVSLILTCVKHPNAIGEIFLVSDDDDLTLPQLLKELSRALKMNCYLISVPPTFIKLITKIIGRKDIYIKLCSSLQVDISRTKELLEWQPPQKIKIALKQTAEYYLKP